MTTSLTHAGPDLAECEAVIERGLGTFIEVGEALSTIRDDKLYRESYPTFDQYCMGRWSMKRAYAYRLIAASSIGAALSPIGDIPNESVARELAPLRAEPRIMKETWAKVIGEHGPEPTTKQVRAAVCVVPRNGNPAKRLPKKDPVKQFDRVVEALAMSSENLSETWNRLSEISPANRSVWAASLRKTRTVISHVIKALEIP